MNILHNLLVYSNVFEFIVLFQIPRFCDGVDCEALVGYRAVYRVSFAMAVFFCLFALLMIQVKSSKDPRAAIHNG